VARVEIRVEDEMVDNDRGGKGPGVRATCDKCGETVTCLGRSQRSVRRCIMLLKEECTDSDGNNFYVDPDIDDRDE